MMSERTVEIIKGMIVEFRYNECNGNRCYANDTEKAKCADVLLDDILTVIKCNEKDGLNVFKIE